MADNDPLQALEQQILEDARRRAEKLLQEARARAEKTLSDGKAAAKAEAAHIMDSGRSRADRQSGMILRTAEQEIARRKLIARDDLVRQSMDNARAVLDNISGDEYRRAIVRLAAAAVRGMNGDRFILRVASPADGSFKPADAAAEVCATIAAEGRNVSIAAEPLDTRAKGVVVQSEDGRLIWNNTFEGRLRRMRADLRRRVAPTLFEET